MQMAKEEWDADWEEEAEFIRPHSDALFPDPALGDPQSHHIFAPTEIPAR